MKALLNLLKSYFEFFINNIRGAKYVVKGKCKRCGTCCRNILLDIEGKFIESEEEFERLKKWNRRYEHFFASGVTDDGSLIFTCKSLKEDESCRDYWFRSLFCRHYPKIDREFLAKKGVTLDGCGYYFDVDKKFKEFLKN